MCKITLLQFDNGLHNFLQIKWNANLPVCVFCYYTDYATGILVHVCINGKVFIICCGL